MDSQQLIQKVYELTERINILEQNDNNNQSADQDEMLDSRQEVSAFRQEAILTRSEINGAREGILKIKEDVEKIKEDVEKGFKLEQKVTWVAFTIIATLLVLTTLELSVPKFKLLQLFLSKVYPSNTIYDNQKEKVSLGDLSKVNNEGPKSIKDWMTKWNPEDYRDVFSKKEFHKVVGEEARKAYIRDLAMFDKKLSAATVIEYGSMFSVPAMLAPVKLSNLPTQTCHRKIQDDEYAAIIVIHKEAPKETYKWFGCNKQYPSKTFLAIKYPDTPALAIDVEVKEVNRSGTKFPNQLEVRLTKKTADYLGITGETPGFIYVTNAID